MAHIDLDKNLPGMRALLAFSPRTAKPLNEMAELLLRSDDHSLSRGERELIGTYVSHLNDCFFCQNVHGGIAQHYLGCDMQFLDAVKEDYSQAAISEKMKALLSIAASVQRSGKRVTAAQVDVAKSCGATEKEIHDTVLIAAFFCMCNRYVDGLATNAPADRQYYVDRGPQRAAEGYLNFDLHR